MSAGFSRRLLVAQVVDDSPCRGVYSPIKPRFCSRGAAAGWRGDQHAANKINLSIQATFLEIFPNTTNDPEVMTERDETSNQH